MLVKKIMPADQIMMGDLPVLQPFPTQKVSDLDPFILLHHHRTTIRLNSHPREHGVDPHPHRGFSPVTFVLKGSILHQDSRGNRKTVNGPGVQWLDAGMGVIHSERPGKSTIQRGGELEIVQIWINLPSGKKMMEPVYQAVESKDATIVNYDNCQLQIYSGRTEEMSGPIDTSWPVLSAIGLMDPGSQMDLNLPKKDRNLLYLYAGQIKVKGFGLIEENHLVVLESNDDGLQLTSDGESGFILLSADKIGEKIHSHGPYVMQNETEILEAMRDFKMGKMGFLVEEF